MDTPTPMLTEEEAEAMARAIYACNPICDQQTDLDGRPVGAVFEISWERLYESDAGCYANIVDAAQAAYAASPASRLSSRLSEVEAENARLLAILEPLRVLSERATAGPWSHVAGNLVEAKDIVAECLSFKADGTLDAAFIPAAVNAVREALALSPERIGGVSQGSGNVPSSPSSGDPDATVHLQWRSDGGLRVWSDTHPGLILSGADGEKVAACIWPAIRILDAHKRGDDWLTLVPARPLEGRDGTPDAGPRMNPPSPPGGE